LSCSTDDELQENPDTSSQLPERQLVQLGKKNKIAFTVENMRKAYSNILANSTASQHPADVANYKSTSNYGNYQINTTHYYVKFSPQDSLQYETIVADTTLAVSDIPFEYDVETSGDIYQDPDYQGTDLTYYYAVVPVGYRLPTSINKEIVADLHFTDEDAIPVDAPEYQLQLVDFYHDLNTEALKITDNLGNELEELQYFYTPPQDQQEVLMWRDAASRGLSLEDLTINFNEEDYMVEKFFGRRESWNPSGNLRLFEDAISQNVGVMGAEIRVRKWGWLVIKRTNTDRAGNFITSSTRTKNVKYACYFQNSILYTVKAGTIFWNARDRSHFSYKRGSWSRTYTSGSDHFYAMINNAAFDYFDRVVSTYKIQRPDYFQRIVGKKWYTNGSSHATIGLLAPFAGYDITITIGSGGRYRGSDGIYATTVHELTHKGHQNLDRGMFSVFSVSSKDRLILKESWAEGVETVVTNDRYFGLTAFYNSTQPGDNGRWNSFRQILVAENMNEYTPIVDDLIDTFNQGLADPARPFDNVSGFTLNQIQGALNNSRNPNDWFNALKNLNVVNQNDLEILFDYVFVVRNNI
jgi:hypothetical protein